jgi:hypothetical protein
MSDERAVSKTGKRRECLELSRSEVEAMIVRELRRRHPSALPISIDFEPRSPDGFCHCWWVSSPEHRA